MFKSSSNDSDAFVFFSISRQFKKFKTKSTSHIDILSDENDKSSSSLNEFDSSAKNINFCRNDSIISRSDFKKLIKD